MRADFIIEVRAMRGRLLRPASLRCRHFCSCDCASITFKLKLIKFSCNCKPFAKISKMEKEFQIDTTQPNAWGCNSDTKPTSASGQTSVKKSFQWKDPSDLGMTRGETITKKHKVARLEQDEQTTQDPIMANYRSAVKNLVPIQHAA